MKWKFCEFCYINGHCENQDRGHKCECYGKKLEDKCERLEKQLKISVEALKYIYDDTKKGHTQCDACGYCSSCETCINVDWAEKALNQLKELEK